MTSGDPANGAGSNYDDAFTHLKSPFKKS